MFRLGRIAEAFETESIRHAFNDTEKASMWARLARNVEAIATEFADARDEASEILACESLARLARDAYERTSDTRLIHVHRALTQRERVAL
jgi:gluconate kinase